MNEYRLTNAGMIREYFSAASDADALAYGQIRAEVTGEAFRVNRKREDGTGEDIGLVVPDDSEQASEARVS